MGRREKAKDEKKHPKQKSKPNQSESNAVKEVCATLPYRWKHEGKQRDSSADLAVFRPQRK